MGGDADEYMDAVFSFCDNSRCNDLELDYNIKDIRSYRIDLKKAMESAEKVGLTELAQAASKLLDASENKDNGYIAANHGSFIKMYRKSTENLESAADRYFS